MKKNIFFGLFLINFCSTVFTMSFKNSEIPEDLKNSIRAACDKEYKEKTAECLIAEVLIEEFIKKDAKNLNIADQLGKTLLIYSVIYGPSRIIRYLVKNKVDINAQDKKGNTALIYAAKLRRKSVVDLLVNAKADVTKKNKAGKTVFNMIEPEFKDIDK